MAGGSFVEAKNLWFSGMWDLLFLCLVLSVWIVLWIVDCCIMLLWLELSSSDVAHGYKSHDGQHGSFGTPTLCWRGRNHTAFDIRAANGAHLSILIFLVCHLINIF